MRPVSDLLLEDAVAAADLTQECFILPHRSGVVTIPMQSTTEIQYGTSFSIRFFRNGGARFSGAEPPDRTGDKFPHPEG